MKKTLALVLALVLCLGMLTACGNTAEPAPAPAPAPAAPAEPAPAEEPASSEPVFVNLAGANSSGTWFIYLNAIATYLMDDYGWVVSCESTSGSPEIIELMGSGDFDFAFINGVNCADAYLAVNSKEGSAPADYLRSICYTYGTAQHLVARKDFGAASIKDLKGARVCVGVAGSNTEITFQNLLNYAGITYDDVTPNYIEGAQAVEALRNGQVDAAIITGPLGNANTLDIMTSGDYMILEIPEDVVAGMKENVSAAYDVFTIPANTYKNQEADVATMVTPTVFLTHEGVSDDLVYKFIQCIYNHIDELIEVNSAISEMSLDNIETGVVTPFHPGAIKYFADQGVTIG